MNSIDVKNDIYLGDLFKKIVQVKQKMGIQKKRAYMSFLFLQLRLLELYYKFSLKKKLEYLYRKYGNSVLFREEISNMLLDIYEHSKNIMTEEQFLDFISNFALSKNIKEMLMEDAKEAIYTDRFKKEIEKHGEKFDRLLATLGEIL